MKNLDTKKILIVMIGLPIVLALIIGGGAAILKGLGMIGKALFPNIWVALGYVYVGFIAFFIGYKKNDNANNAPRESTEAEEH